MKKKKSCEDFGADSDRSAALQADPHLPSSIPLERPASMKWSLRQRVHHQCKSKGNREASMIDFFAALLTALVASLQQITGKTITFEHSQSTRILGQVCSGINNVTAFIEAGSLDCRFMSIVLLRDVAQTPLGPHQLRQLMELEEFKRAIGYVGKLWVEMANLPLLPMVKEFTLHCLDDIGGHCP